MTKPFSDKSSTKNFDYKTPKPDGRCTDFKRCYTLRYLDNEPKSCWFCEYFNIETRKCDITDEIRCKDAMQRASYSESQTKLVELLKEEVKQ